MSAQNLAPQPYQCPTCGSASKSINPRNLALFIDGTSNKPGPEKTNVRKLYEAMPDNDTSDLLQNKTYFEGIGAHNDLLPGTGKMIYNGFDMVVAWSVEMNVKNAYRWLIERYQKGDRIYMFGFSRGAYQVRALAGMVHEVGLLRKNEDRVEQAYRHYLAIDPKNPETRRLATEFKQNFCHADVRIHFIGVWDTVSSLGLRKQHVNVTASASVTNACHFRHALALDERRVKFMPEYFLEMNAHEQSSKPFGDVKEFWFAGCHGDVGGISRPHQEVIPNPLSDEDLDNPIHAGNVPLVWMEREAKLQGLNFRSKGFVWNPEDVDLGRLDSMTIWWRLLEYIPIHHQVSFSGTGKDGWRRHLCCPRLVIPGQYMHSSALPGDVYTPRATFPCGVHIPTMPQMDSGGRRKIESWRSDFLDKNATTRLLTSLLRDQEKALNSIWEVLLLLDFRLDTKQTQHIPIPGWLSETMMKQHHLEKFTLTVIHDTISYSSAEVSSDLTYSKPLEDARKSLEAMLSPVNELYYPQVFYVIRFSSRHQKLRQHFIAYDEVISGLIRALEYTAKSRRKNLFPLVADSLCCLMQDEGKRGYIIDQLAATSDETQSGTTILSRSLDVTVRVHLIASLKMVATLARYASPAQMTELREGLKSKVHQLARFRKVPVGSAAVEALVALGEQQNVADDFHFYNIVGYLHSTLPLLDAEDIPDTDDEADSASSDLTTTSKSKPVSNLKADGTATPSYPNLDLPPVFRVNESGTLDANDVVMCKLLQALELSNAQKRTVATLTLPKLCGFRDFCLAKNIAETFVRQLGRKDTSLLAAYALKTCLKLEMWKPDNFAHAINNIKTMLDKGCFDDAVGRVEGFGIFRELMANDNLRRQLMDHDIITILEKKLEGDHHETRMSLISLDILTAKESSLDLKSRVNTGIVYLSKDQRTQRKGIKILAALAQTEAGEQAIRPRLADIVKMLLLPADDSFQEHPNLLAPATALYELCKNENLRNEIKNSEEYTALKHLRQVKNAPFESRTIR